jgi:MFS family permease
MATQKHVWNIARVASGHFLEMYDFTVFAYYATSIGRAFFPSDNDFVSLMATLMAFGAGFLMRPIGAVVLGAYADRHGRRKGLLLTLGLMGLGTASLALTPGYASIGLLAPLLIVSGRLIQGFSAGAELGAVSIYLSEIAPDHRRGFFTAWQSASQQLAVVFAAALGLALNALLPPAAMNVWGWRVPLFIGCAIIPLIWLFRRHLKESPAFLERPQQLEIPELLRRLLRNWPMVLAGALLSAMTTVTFYAITAYTPTFGSQVLKLSARAAFGVTLCVGLSNFVWLLAMGALSDRIGRKPFLVGITILAMLTAYPAMAWLVAAPSFERLLLVELYLSFIFGSYNGAAMAYLAETVPREVRASGFSLAFSLANGLFGGFTPAIVTALIQATHNRAMPGAWVSTAALLGLIGYVLIAALTRRTLRA